MKAGTLTQSGSDCNQTEYGRIYWSRIFASYPLAADAPPLMIARLGSNFATE